MAASAGQNRYRAGTCRRLGQCSSSSVAARPTLQSTFINWADENHGDHDECLARIWTTIRETFYRFSIKNVYYC